MNFIKTIEKLVMFILDYGLYDLSNIVQLAQKNHIRIWIKTDFSGQK